MSGAPSARRLLGALLAILSCCACGNTRAPSYEDRYRPSYHFTPARNWMNDPNGLVFHDGEYHLFFQHNPLSADWGNLSWGHAVSADLVNWRELGVAIPHGEVLIFSGSAVLDRRNSAGFARGEAPALVAIYTGFNPRTEAENQNLAFSVDRGRTWTRYAGNPILSAPGEGAFRDPKVFWHEPSQRWIMTVVRSGERAVVTYASDDLRSWREQGRFGPAGLVAGAWETPDLFELPLDAAARSGFLSSG